MFGYKLLTLTQPQGEIAQLKSTPAERARAAWFMYTLMKNHTGLSRNLMECFGVFLCGLIWWTWFEERFTCVRKVLKRASLVIEFARPVRLRGC